MRERNASAREILRALVWPSIAVAATLVAMRGVFSTDRIFFLRDLGMHFWPSTLWMRDMLASGEFPLWDPYLAYGQSAVANPLYQLFFLPAYVRFLAGDVVGFNLWVALPFPVAAVGTYLLLRSQASRPASALGAIVFACSGPVLSTGNFPNLSWAIALLPWVLRAADALFERPCGLRFAALATAAALQVLAGEPVTFGATAVLVMAYAVSVGVSAGGLRERSMRAALALGGLGSGLLLSACQLLPLVDQVGRSARATGIRTDFGVLHPARLLEVVAPNLFGDYLQHEFEGVPLLALVNGGRDPFLYSVFVGAGALVLAVAGALLWRNRARARFWTAATLALTVVSLGGHTPVYRLLVAALPVIESFRYPTKYLLVATIGVAVLAATGWDALACSGSRGRTTVTSLAATLAAVAAVLALWTVMAPVHAFATFAGLLGRLGLGDPAPGAAYLVTVVPTASARLLIVASAVTVLVWLGRGERREAAVARWLLSVVVVVELLAAGWALNPTLPADLFGEPRWVAATRERPDDRIYIGGRASTLFPVAGIDADGPPGRMGLRVDLPTVAARYVESAKAAYYPAAWRMRESLSTDLPALGPLGYYRVTRRFVESDLDTRVRFLRRTGVGYFLMSRVPSEDAKALVFLPTLLMTLYEIPGPEPRAQVVGDARIVPEQGEQIRLMFDADFDPASSVLLDAPPPAPVAGASSDLPGEGANGAATLVHESASELTVRATVPREGGYLVLYDSYDPNWTVDVDGAPAPLLRANGIFRAVPLAEGVRVVRFSYRPAPLTTGLTISVGMLVMLVVMARVWRRRDENVRATPDVPETDVRGSV